ncbi:substrate-binding periplasmic protein [Lysobacter terrae]
MSLALLLAAWPALAAPASSTAPIRVRYPAQESVTDARRGYPIAVLQLALERSGRRYTLEAANTQASQLRVLRLVGDGTLDVAWSVLTREREQELRPVRFPIDRGLIGWRVLLVRRDAAASFAQVRSVQDLARRLGVQGHDWPDLSILRSNGLQVTPGSSYDGLFAMLSRGHIDYLPRSVAEVGDELAARPDLGLAVEPTLLLHYPSALYFFVHPDNIELADALATGLQLSERDGSLQRLFEQAYGERLASLQLSQRRVLELANPLLSPATPVPGASWWQPAEAQPGRAP